MAEDTSVKAAPEMEPKATKSKGKKGKRIVQAGEAHIQATFNNTIVSVTDKKGEILDIGFTYANEMPAGGKTSFEVTTLFGNKKVKKKDQAFLDAAGEESTLFGEDEGQS